MKTSDLKIKRAPWNKGKKLPPLSDEQKLKIGLANLGKKRSDEARQKYSVAKKKNPPRSMLGKKHTAETREKMRETALKTGKKPKDTPEIREKRKRVGKNHWRWKGGYQNKLLLNRNRRMLKLSIAGSHTLGDWEELKRMYNYRCPCCLISEPKITLTEDHIVPISRGGSNNIENIQPLCRSCNSRKHTQIKHFKL